MVDFVHLINYIYIIIYVIEVKRGPQNYLSKGKKSGD